MFRVLFPHQHVTADYLYICTYVASTELPSRADGSSHAILTFSTSLFLISVPQTQSKICLETLKSYSGYHQILRWYLILHC